MKPKQFTYILCAILAVVVIGGLGGFYFAHKMLASKITKLQQLSADIKLESAQVARLAKLETQFRQFSPLDKKAQSVLPPKKDQDQVIGQISAIVTRNGLSINGLEFDKTSGLPGDKTQTQPGNVGGILVMPVKFSGSGSYQQLIGLLSSFEQQQRYMQVTNLNIEREDSNKLNFSMNLNVFLKP